jgi:hypothetical protein
MCGRTEEVIVALAVVLLTLCTPPLWGQAVANAQISGLVADPSGAAVATAKVTVRQAETGLVRTANTGPDGTYMLPNLSVGLYRLEVRAAGFETYVQSGIDLQVGENPTINITLRLGQVSQRVEVTANANMVQT